MVSVDLTTAALLADGRFPSGGHAHSAGFEVASRFGDLTDPVAFDAFLVGRLSTTGRTEGHLVAVLVARLADGSIDWEEADAEITARIVSPALREVSRSLGRQWTRASRRLWPGPAVEGAARSHPEGAHQVAATAAAFHSAGLGVDEAVTLHLHHLCATVTSAAIRLHGLDPYEAQCRQLASADLRRDIVADATRRSGDRWADVPAWSGPLSEIGAEIHAVADGRLFQS